MPYQFFTYAGCCSVVNRHIRLKTTLTIHICFHSYFSHATALLSEISAKTASKLFHEYLPVSDIFPRANATQIEARQGGIAAARDVIINNNHESNRALTIGLFIFMVVLIFLVCVITCS